MHVQCCCIDVLNAFLLLLVCTPAAGDDGIPWFVQFLLDYRRAAKMDTIILFCCNTGLPGIPGSSTSSLARSLAAVPHLHLSVLRPNVTFEPDFNTLIVTTDDTFGVTERNLLNMPKNGTLFFEGRFWLMLTEVKETEQFHHTLSKLELYVDNDVRVGSVFRNGTVMLEEVYKVGVDASLTHHQLETWSLQDRRKFKLSLADKYDRRSNLQGHTLQAIGIGGVYPFWSTLGNVSGQLVITGGLFGEVLFALQDMLNFTYELKYQKDRIFGDLKEDGVTWAGMVGTLQRREADITASELSIGEERSQVIDYTMPVLTTGQRVYVKLGNQGSGLSHGAVGFTAPLAVSLWVAMLVAMPLVTLVLCLVSIVHPQEISRRDAFWMVLCMVLQQGIPDPPSSTPGRISFWSGCVLFLVAFISYSAKLVSFLTVETTTMPIHSVEELLASKSTGWGLGLQSNDFAKTEFERAPNGSLMQRLWKEVVLRNPKRNLVESVYEGLIYVLEGRYAFVAPDMMVDWQKSQMGDERCAIVALDTAMLMDSMGFGLQKNSPYKSLLDYSLLKLIQGGAMHRMRTKWRPELPTCLHSAYKPMDFGHALPLLVTFAFGVGLALSTLIFECIINLKKKCTKTTPNKD